MKKLVSVLLVVLGLASSCVDDVQDNNPKTFEINPKSCNITALAQKLEFKVDCDKQWTASLAKGTWATLSVSTGSISLAARLNDTPDPRTDTLVVKSGTLSRRVPVVQQGISSVLSATDLTLVGTAPGTLTLHAAADWSASVSGNSADAAWLTMEPASGSKGDVVIKFSANEENLNVGDRNLLVKFTMGENKFNATITQKQTDAILGDKSKVELSNGAQDFSINLQSNVQYTVDIDCDWIEKIETKALNNTTETFRVSANPDADTREGHIVFKSPTVSETVTVFQAECDVLLLGESLCEATQDGGRFNVELRSNVDYEIIWPDVSWISPAGTSGKVLRAPRSDALSFEVQPNPELQPREAEIVVKDRDSDLSATLLVRQEAKTPAFLKTDVPGLYDPDGNTVLSYSPGKDQTASRKKDGIRSFRIMRIPGNGYFTVNGIPDNPKAGDSFRITVKTNMDMPVDDGSSLDVFVIRTEGRKVWLFEESGYGFIIKK